MLELKINVSFQLCVIWSAGHVRVSLNASLPSSPVGCSCLLAGALSCKYFNFILPLREPRLHSLDPDPIWTRVKVFQGHPFWLHTFYSLSWLAALYFLWLRIRAWIIGNVALHFKKGVVGEFHPSEEFTYVIPVPQDRSINTCELQQPSTKAINSRTKP